MWCDDLDQIVPLCKEFNAKLLQLLLDSRKAFSTAMTMSSARTSLSTPAGSTARFVEMIGPNGARGSQDSRSTGSPLAIDSKPEATTPPANAAEGQPKKRSRWGWKLSPKAAPTTPADVEKVRDPAMERPGRLFSPFYAGLAFGLSICESSEI